VLDTLEQALYDRQPGSSDALVHHSDRGSQYLSVRYTERLAEVGIEPSVGSRVDSYDNALAETINGLDKAELIHRRAPSKTRDSVALAPLQWVHWFKHIRLLEPVGYIPLAESEANYWQRLASQTAEAVSTETNRPPGKPGRFSSVRAALLVGTHLFRGNLPESRKIFPVCAAIGLAVFTDIRTTLLRPLGLSALDEKRLNVPGSGRLLGHT
jgi:hypothetical protein